ncbi:MAG TPA: acyl-CoA dehydrogenase, partial [Trinickia sp.]|nr:acyl-CoA dehydrogenase [Trinickia sp.]
MASRDNETALDWPFFDEHHRTLAAGIEAWCAAQLPAIAPLLHDRATVDDACRRLVRALGEA